MASLPWTSATSFNFLTFLTAHDDVSFHLAAFLNQSFVFSVIKNKMNFSKIIRVIRSQRERPNNQPRTMSAALLLGLLGCPTVADYVHREASV